MTVSWPVFFAGFAAVFLVLNSVFATLYLLAPEPIANARPGSLSDLFFFSIETLATVGYGDMHPQTIYGHLLATAEIFTGMSSLAVVGGLVFARFSRPRARILFSNVAVIGRHDGHRTLMIRLANARQDLIDDARVKLWFSAGETTQEGITFRRFHALPLDRDENPLFALSWTIFHRITIGSPLYGREASDLDEIQGGFVLTFAGVDGPSGQQVHSRQWYPGSALRWNARFADILTTNDHGLRSIDYGRFHDIVPQGERDADQGLDSPRVELRA